MIYDDKNDAAGENGEGGKKEPTQAQRLIQLALTSAELFHSPDKTAYVTIEIKGHKETMCLRSKTFRGWLVREFYLAEDKPPGSQAMTDAIQLLDAQAVFDGVEITSATSAWASSTQTSRPMRPRSMPVRGLSTRDRTKSGTT